MDASGDGGGKHASPLRCCVSESRDPEPVESETKQWPDAVLLQDATTWGNSQSRVVRVGHQGAAMPRPIKHCNGQNPDGTDFFCIFHCFVPC